MNNNTLRPGIKPGVPLSIFTEEERSILKTIATRDWLVTRAESIGGPGNNYKAVLLKPMVNVREAFNLQREVITVFSPYAELDVRSIDAFDRLNIPDLRPEEICCILISKDNNAVEKVDSLLRANQESRIVVPFTYEELLGNKDTELILNRIRDKFYSRDLFGIQEALRQERYFFGRKELIHELVNQHLSGSCSGVFGLRKTGKTSVLYGVQRALDKKDAVSVFIDCQTLHLESWNGAVYRVIELACKACCLKQTTVHSKAEYESERDVPELFQEDIHAIHIAKKRSILLIFDEIENITFETSPSTPWKSGSAFICFWQVLRSTYQHYSGRGVFTYLVAGTNPHCVETPSINGTDNPVFSQFQPHYLQPFDFAQTKEMVLKLGSYMGIRFGDEIITHLVEDYGGHPLLMRQACSYIHKHVTNPRPITVTKPSYEKNKAAFYRETGGFIQYAKMILHVLKDWYHDEYEMLVLLAKGEETEFWEFANTCPELVAHLLQYGIIVYNDLDQTYSFRIEAIQSFLSTEEKSKTPLCNELQGKSVFISYSHDDEKWREKLEKHLKATVKSDCHFSYWSDKNIKAGVQWRQSIEKAINEANIAVLLVSVSFLASDFINEVELPLLFKRRKQGTITILPLIVSPCDYDYSILNSIQSVNSPNETLEECMGDNGRVDRTFLRLIQEIRKVSQ